MLKHDAGKKMFGKNCKNATTAALINQKTSLKSWKITEASYILLADRGFQNCTATWQILEWISLFWMVPPN